MACFKQSLLSIAFIFCGVTSTTNAQLDLQLQYEVPILEGADEYHTLVRDEAWQTKRTAVIVCDMWDSHHCVNAVRRVGQIAPRIDALLKNLRAQGATIIHAPSGCMDFYQDHPARKNAQNISVGADLPEDIDTWCYKIDSELADEYPIDQSDGGEDDDPLERKAWEERLDDAGKNVRTPWTRQTPRISIDANDYITDSGSLIWSILERGEIDNVILVGVHTNMCVLGRPFGLRRLATAGKNVVLCRDLTDTMYNPKSWPFASHFTGTDLIVSHIQRHVCPTITSNQILGGQPLRFRLDRRPHLVILIAEAEYQTKDTLPVFAAQHLSRDYRVTTLHADAKDRNRVPGMHMVADADLLLVSARRRALPTKDLQFVRDHVAAGKPMVGIRTASHAFALRRDDPPAGHDVWPEFDAQVWGGAYTNHFGNKLRTNLSVVANALSPVQADDLGELQPGGSLYKNIPLKAGTKAILTGHVVENGQPSDSHPLAWTFIRTDGGKSFYTSLGHVDDFAQPEFQALLLRGIHWAAGIKRMISVNQVRQDAERYTKKPAKLQ
ncbi:MAG TPA: nicotinamidase [Planctomycetaceae bacterium]|nr:nicotinamidase [Planctomycetaceae bacterium]